MTLPDELVAAAAEAICAARTIECRRLGCCKFYEDHARLAVVAVLRALPECEGAITAGGYALMQSEGADHPDLDFSLALRKDEARTVLAAIAKLAGDA